MNDYLTGLPSDWYATRVISESDRIAAACASQPDAPVTTCGDWTVRRLVQHLGAVQRWATHIVEHGTEPDDKGILRAPEGAEADELARWLTDGAAAAAARLGSVDADAECWNPWPVPQIMGVWPRRMAQETAMHRYDVSLAVGDTEPIEAQLASDGIDEYLLWAVPRSAAEGTTIPSGSLHLHCTDVDGEWLASVDGDVYSVAREHVKGDAALRGTANDLLLALWGRPVAEGAIEIAGDVEVADAWLAIGGR